MRQPTSGGFVNTPNEVVKRISTAPRKMSFRLFILLVVILIGLGIFRSAIATRLDSFTMDEAYHIAAGVSYFRYGDFRVNPEQPPLVKLWVGSIVSSTGFQMNPLRKFSDKPDERVFTEGSVFHGNDPDSVQRRARIAMYTLNGLLLAILAIVLKRVFDYRVALGALIFLVIDPTVAAHLPVVMTDLPVALLSAIAVAFAARAFSRWIWTDLAVCSLFLGLALATKHSAPVVLLSVLAIGAVLAVFQPSNQPKDSRLRRFGKLTVVLSGALAVLWSFYFFRYAESRTCEEQFNRPLASKIAEVGTPGYHLMLAVMASTHIVPRAYLWGFADTIHAGMEGRSYPQLAFGRVYFRKAPVYFFPGILLVKLPIGLTLLSLLGLILFLAKRLPEEWNLSAGITLGGMIFFLLVLANGATYAGVRHALPVLVLLSIFSGIAAAILASQDSRAPKVIVSLAFVMAAISTLPVMRPWEYFNEFVGGPKNAYKYFYDEGTDLGQRTKEIVRYYRQEVQPRSELADVYYSCSNEELKGRGVDYLGRDMKRDLERMRNPERAGTIFASAWALNRKGYWDYEALINAKPSFRFGNLFIFKGTFLLPGLAASSLYDSGIDILYSDKPDEQEAERLFRLSMGLDPTAFFVHIEIGNLCLKRGDRGEALKEYSAALQYAPQDMLIREPIEEQIKHLQTGTDKEVSPLRDPYME